MSAPEIEPEDVAEMRRTDPDGWRRYMRQQITNGRTRREQPAVKPVLKPPGHRPGVWPPGCSPPGPPPERQIPAHEWRSATRHYSNETNRPDQPCDCGQCRKETR